MAGNSAIREGLRALSQFFIDEGTLGDTLLRVAQLACAVSPADMAGITMLVDGRPRTGVFTDPEAPDIDNSQYDSGRGPCLDAFRDQHVYRIDSIADEKRWPEFTREAAAHGIVASLSTPILAPRSTIDQAIGILMADGGSSPDEAFQLLVRASQRENRKLRDIAPGIVGRVARSAAPG